MTFVRLTAPAPRDRHSHEALSVRVVGYPDSGVLEYLRAVETFAAEWIADNVPRPIRTDLAETEIAGRLVVALLTEVPEPQGVSPRIADALRTALVSRLLWARRAPSRTPPV